MAQVENNVLLGVFTFEEGMGLHGWLAGELGVVE
jgi:hypothetical protein